MTKPAKVLTIVALALLALPIGATLLLAGSLVTHGIVTVNVKEPQKDGTRLYLPVPAGLVYLGLDLLPLLDRDGEFARAKKEVGPWAPVAVAALEELEDCPDAVLVDVQERGETVQIVKVGSKIEIHVHDQNGDVQVSLPAHLFTHVVRQFA